MWARVNKENIVVELDIKPNPYTATSNIDLSSKGWYWLQPTTPPNESPEYKVVDNTLDNLAIIQNNNVIQQWRLEARKPEEILNYKKTNLNFDGFRLALLSNEHFLNWQVAIKETSTTIDDILLSNLRDAALLGNLEIMQSQYDLLKINTPPSDEAIEEWKVLSNVYLFGLFKA